MSDSWDEYGRQRSRGDDYSRRTPYGDWRDGADDARPGPYASPNDRTVRRDFSDGAPVGAYGYDRSGRGDYGHERNAYRRDDGHGFRTARPSGDAATRSSRFDPNVHYSDRDANRPGERSFFERAGDEVASWFGDEDAERRRDADKRHAGRGPKNYTRSDERIHGDVNDRLTDDPYIDASDVEVTVKDREVTLSGFVETREQKRRAEDVAERVSGVQHVQNNLRVQREATGSGFSASRSQSHSYEERGTTTTITGLGRTTIDE